MSLDLDMLWEQSNLIDYWSAHVHHIASFRPCFQWPGFFLVQAGKISREIYFWRRNMTGRAASLRRRCRDRRKKQVGDGNSKAKTAKRDSPLTPNPEIFTQYPQSLIPLSSPNTFINSPSDVLYFLQTSLDSYKFWFGVLWRMGQDLAYEEWVSGYSLHWVLACFSCFPLSPSLPPATFSHRPRRRLRGILLVIWKGLKGWMGF